MGGSSSSSRQSAAVVPSALWWPLALSASATTRTPQACQGAIRSRSADSRERPGASWVCPSYVIHEGPGESIPVLTVIDQRDTHLHGRRKHRARRDRLRD